MKVDLHNKVALVTGAARNIGKAIADVYAQNGAMVIYADIDYELVKEAAAHFPNCMAQQMDVTDSEQIKSVIEKVSKQYKRLDILVNNAGAYSVKYRVNIDEFPQQEWHRIIDVNLTGVYRLSSAVIKVMKKQQGGRIINIASVAGIVPLRLQCAYTASKAGVINLTKAMALELAPHILVNAIAPGSILTDATREVFYEEDGSVKGKAQQMLSHIPLGRPGNPEDIAYAALYLAAPESSYMNGNVLTVDGGWTAGYARDF